MQHYVGYCRNGPKEKVEKLMKTNRGPGTRSFVAGAAGGAIAVVVMAVIAATLMRRLGPRMMDRMMACCDKCGCGKADEPESDRADH
jgi:hypothetical protein